LKRVSRNDAHAGERLAALERAKIEERFSIAVTQKGIRGADETYLKAKLAMHSQEILKINLPDMSILREHPLLVIKKEDQADLLKKMLAVLGDFHQSNPLLPGIPKQELHSRFFPKVPEETFFAIVDHAVQQGKLQAQKEFIVQPGRRVTLTNEQESAANHAEKFLAQAGLEFPGLDAFAKELKLDRESATKILYVLVRQGKVFKIAEDYFLHKSTWEDVKNKIRARKTTQRTFSVPDFKTVFGLSRKYAIPLLEQLDREGVTRRSGNERIIL
jgi:selenocysteine-specific elongation factor